MDHLRYNVVQAWIAYKLRLPHPDLVVPFAGMLDGQNYRYNDFSRRENHIAINDTRLRHSGSVVDKFAGLQSPDFLVFKAGFDPQSPRKRSDFETEEQKGLYDEGWAAFNRASLELAVS